VPNAPASRFLFWDSVVPAFITLNRSADNKDAFTS
jgi:hypothetical protein